MKTRVLVALLLLAICTVIYASEDINDPELYWRKTQEMNQMAEGFKAETGFVGYIGHNLQYMRFSRLSGNFTDLVFAAPQDTVFMRQAFDMVVSKLMPYIPAREGQLYGGKVVSNVLGTRVIYRQKINGFSIEGGGGALKMQYRLATHQLNVTNSTVDISSDPVPINLSLEQAISLVQEKVFDGAEVKPTNPRIAYVPIDDENRQAYYLCYILTSRGYTVFVDVSEPLIRKVAPNLISRSFNVNVLGNVYKKAYTDTINIPLSQQSMGSVLVQTPIDSLYADIFGQQTVSDSIYTWLKTELRNHEIFHVVQYPDTMTVVKQDSVSISGSQIVSYFLDNDANTANVYYHAHHQQQFIDGLVDDDDDNNNMHQPWFLKIITNYPYTFGGDLDHNENTIRISHNSGKLSHTVRHELSHANMYSILHTLFNNSNDDTKDAMDEAFAVYFPCAAIESPYCIYGNPQDPQRIDTLNHISTVNPVHLNERAYEDYNVRHTIASAWWDIRNKIGDNQFDQELIEGVMVDVDETYALRYKPRYFYNILMRNAGDNQEIIDEAYARRGLHFYPKVQSYSLAQKPRNCFSAGNQVHVNITEAPQNTPFKVYVIRHGDYTYTNGASVSTLNNHLASDFTPIEERTDADGRWSGLIWTIPTITENAIGDYDIIVDFGSPEGPDGLIHYAFNAADVMDGFDGLNGPGFTVYDNGIDVVTSSVKSRYQRMLID